MKKILQQKEKILREVAKDVPLSQIKSVKIKKIIKEMTESLKSQHDGVAIAAPQIGYSLRIFLVSGRVLGKRGADSEKESLPDMIFINPKITKLSKEKGWAPEGCLSVRWLYGKTHRSKKATLVAYNENGKKFTRGASGLLAQIFQHETDHLDGTLFIDLGERVKDVKEDKPKE